MNATISTSSKINLLEKKYLASRITCLVLTTLLVMYLLPISTRGLTATIVSGSLALFFSIQFFFQFRVLNFILGVIMFMIGAFFSLAAISEFNEFETITRDAWLLLIVGLGMCISIMVLSAIMVWKAAND